MKPGSSTANASRTIGTDRAKSSIRRGERQPDQDGKRIAPRSALPATAHGCRRVISSVFSSERALLLRLYGDHESLGMFAKLADVGTCAQNGVKMGFA